MLIVAPPPCRAYSKNIKLTIDTPVELYENYVPINDNNVRKVLSVQLVDNGAQLHNQPLSLGSAVDLALTFMMIRSTVVGPFSHSWTDNHRTKLSEKHSVSTIMAAAGTLSDCLST